LRVRLAAIAAASLLIGTVGGISRGTPARPPALGSASSASGEYERAAPTPAPRLVFNNELEAAGGRPRSAPYGARRVTAETAITGKSGRPPLPHSVRSSLRESVPSTSARSEVPSERAATNVGSADASVEPRAPQSLGVNFLGAEDDGAFRPPDSMGAVGPSQFLVAVNGRIRTFAKTGTADNALNDTLDHFFSSVGVSPSCDPRVRYDRAATRWFVTAIDACEAGQVDNHILIAVSTGPQITSTDWSFFKIAADAGTFTDFDTLGIDGSALYIGANVFDASETFVNTTAYVVRKTSVLGSGPIVFTEFANLISTATGTGPVSPVGVDDLDIGTTHGYFIGVDFFRLDQLDLLRVDNPGGTPTISSVKTISVPTTSLPINVPQPVPVPKLDAGDDRLGNAVIRGGRLWTSHNIEVDSTGTAHHSGGGGRDGVRWYEVQNLASVPTLEQSGTVFDSSASVPFSYWMPSVMVSGQGHAALGFSRAGAKPVGGFASAATTGRLSADPQGTTGAVTLIQGSSFLYHPTTNDPERWGDYSFTSVDPNDDMTMWTIQEYTSASNKWGVRVAQLKAPAPVITGIGAVPADTTSTQVPVIGKGFFEPGTSFPNHLTATATDGIIVNGVTSVTPSQVVLDLKTTGVAAGDHSLTITNPDGQTASATLTLGGVTPQMTLAPLTLAFGSVVVGVTSGGKTVTVTNSGSVPLVIGDLSITGTAPTDFKTSSDACSQAKLDPAQTCLTQLKFSPTRVGARSATLLVPTNASTQPASVSLSGIGLQPAATPTPPPAPALPSPSITVTSSPLIAGHVASLEGKNFSGLARLSIFIRSTPVLVGSVTTNEVGSFSTTFTIPAATTPGTHTLEVTRAGSTTVLASKTVTIQAASTAAPTKLPNTGANIGDLVRMALLLLGIGAGLVVAGRHRRSAP